VQPIPYDSYRYHSGIACRFWIDCHYFCDAAFISAFGVVAPAFIIGLLGLGITARDGVLIIIGFVLSLGVAYGVTSLILTRF